MGPPQQSRTFTFDVSMAWEAAQPKRHEYLNGEAFTMTGARGSHHTNALNVPSPLRSALRGAPCRVFMTDMKLRAEAADAVFYPDLSITCAPRGRGPDADAAKPHPTLRVEARSERVRIFLRPPEQAHDGLIFLA
jgi:Uma2 family endonuclease